MKVNQQTKLVLFVIAFVVVVAWFIGRNAAAVLDWIWKINEKIFG